MRRWAWTSLVLLGLALAQGGEGQGKEKVEPPPPQGEERVASPSGEHREEVLLSPKEVTELIAGARSEVLVEMEVFDDRVIAEGYRRAVGERGAKGYILTRKDTAEIEASYIPWASILPGSGIRLLAYTRKDYVVVDRKWAILREIRRGLPVYRLVEEKEEVLRLVRDFVRAYEIALPYSVGGIVKERARRFLR